MMLRRGLVVGLLASSLVVSLGAEARAQLFDGWAFFCCSEVTGIIDLSSVPNPNSRPSIVTVEGTMDSIEVICTTPQGRLVAGNAGTRVVETTDDPVGNEDITDRKRGRATIQVPFGEEALAAAETSSACVNPQWSVVPGSAAPTAMALTMESFRCLPESNQDAEPCVCNNFSGCGEVSQGGLTTESVPQDTVHLRCTLDPILRNPDGTVAHPFPPSPENPEGKQIMTCVKQ